MILVTLLDVGCARCRKGASDVLGTSVGGQQLMCFVGPNMRVPMQDLAHAYQKQTGLKVIVRADEVRTLIDELEGAKSADLFVTHDPFLAMAISKGIFMKDAWTVASVEPVIAVPAGNPRHITKLEDLARPGLKVGLTDMQNSISGQIITVMLKKAGIAQQVEANVTKTSLVGRGVAANLLAGEIDACIVWNVVAFGNRDKIDAVSIEPKWRPERGAMVQHPTLGPLELDYVRVTVSTLAASKNPAAADAFARFVVSPQGQAVFVKNGFLPPDPARPTLLRP